MPNCADPPPELGTGAEWQMLLWEAKITTFILKIANLRLPEGSQKSPQITQNATYIVKSVILEAVKSPKRYIHSEKHGAPA